MPWGLGVLAHCELRKTFRKPKRPFEKDYLHAVEGLGYRVKVEN